MCMYVYLLTMTMHKIYDTLTNKRKTGYARNKPNGWQSRKYLILLSVLNEILPNQSQVCESDSTKEIGLGLRHAKPP